MLIPLNIFLSGGLNISSPQMQSHVLPDNRTIQNFVKDYVEEYVGKHTVKGRMNAMFELIDLFEQGYIFSKVTTPFHLDMLSFPIQGERNLSSLQSPQPPNNRTLQSFVEAYLGKYTRRGLIALIVFKYFYIILFLQINYSFFFF